MTGWATLAVFGYCAAVVAFAGARAGAVPTQPWLACCAVTAGGMLSQALLGVAAGDAWMAAAQAGAAGLWALVAWELGRRHPKRRPARSVSRVAGLGWRLAVVSMRAG